MTRSHGRGRSEAGQVVVVTAVLMTVLVGAAALAVDVGSLFSARGQLQEIADAASFAAARHLPELPASGTCSPLPTDSAGLAACNSVLANLQGTRFASTAQITWSTPFDGSHDEVEVKVTAKSGSIFAGIFGILSSNVSAVSAAKLTPGDPEPSALFAADTSCSNPGVTITTNNTHVARPGGGNAAIISNGALNISVNNGTFGHTTYSGPNQCVASIQDNHISFDAKAAPTPYVTTQPLPLTYDSAALCTLPGVHTGANLSITDGVTGIWCASNSISTSGNDVSSGSGGVTLIAPQIDLSANNVSLKAPTSGPTNGLLALAYGSGTSFAPGANNVTFTGVIAVPSGTVDIESNNTITGFIEAQDITIDNNNMSLTGTGPLISARGRTVSYSE